MKSFLLSAVFLLAVSCVFSSKVDFHHADPPHKDCSTHSDNEHGHHLLHEKIEKLNRGEPVAADDSETIQHLLCVLKERRILSEDGTINKDVVKGRITKILGEGSPDIEKVAACAVQRSDQKETALSFYNCVAPLVKKFNNA